MSGSSRFGGAGGVMVGKYRIMERSQEAVIIIQEDLIVTLVGDGSRDGTRSSDSIYIYIYNRVYFIC